MTQRLGTRRSGWTVLVVLALVAALVPLSSRSASAADPCVAPVNVIACENTKPGTPESVWDITGSGDPTIQGFATDMSVNVGQTESFKIKTVGQPYTIDIYRLGWYGGDGARLITSVTPSATLPQAQPACGTIPNATRLVARAGGLRELGGVGVVGGAVDGRVGGVRRAADPHGHRWGVATSCSWCATTRATPTS